MVELVSGQADGAPKPAGAPLEYISLPDAAHAMHAADPQRFATVVTNWAKRLAP